MEDSGRLNAENYSEKNKKDAARTDDQLHIDQHIF